MIIKEPPRYSPKLLLTFNNGIIDRDDQSALGYVSDLSNIDIEGGKAVRRQGSINLLPVGGAQAEYLLNKNYFDEIEIAGAKCLISVTAGSEVRIFNKTFPQILFRVYSRKKSNYPEQIIFTRGARFFGWNTGRFYFISNEFGDCFRIDLRGKIDWFYDSKKHVTNTTYQFTGTIENIYNEKIQAGRVLLDVLDATNKELKDFYVMEDSANNIYPTKGIVRIASVNPCGVISKWNDGININTYKNSLFSVIDGLTFTKKDSYDPFGNYISTAKYYFNNATEYDDVIRASYASGFTGSYIGYDNDTAEIKFNINDWVGDTAIPTAVLINADSPNIMISAISNTLYLNSKTQLSLGLYRIQNCLVLKKYFDNISGSIAPVTTKFVSEKDHVIYVKKEIGVIANYHTEITESSDPTDFQFGSTLSNVYRYEIQMDQWLKELINSYAAETYFYSSTAFAYTFVMQFGMVGPVNIRFLPVTKSGYEMLHIGADCWTYNGYKNIPDDNVKYDFDEKKLYIYLSSNDNLGVLLNSDPTDYITNGHRFAIWNNNQAIISQKAWIENANQIVYQKSVDDYMQVINGKYMAVGAVPVMSTHLKSLRQFPVEINENEKIVANMSLTPVYNNGILFVVDGNDLYISDETFMLKSKVKMDGAVKHLVRFYDGAIAFTDKGAYRILQNGTATPIFDAKTVKAAGEAKGNVVTVNDDNSVYLFSIYYDQGGTARVSSSDLSVPIKDVIWQSNVMIAYARDIIWILNGSDIYGFELSKDAEAGWKHKYSFNYEIRGIFSYDNELLIYANNYPDIAITRVNRTLGGG